MDPHATQLQPLGYRHPAAKQHRSRAQHDTPTNCAGSSLKPRVRKQASQHADMSAQLCSSTTNQKHAMQSRHTICTEIITGTARCRCYSNALLAPVDTHTQLCACGWESRHLTPLTRPAQGPAVAAPVGDLHSGTWAAAATLAVLTRNSLANPAWVPAVSV